MLKGSDPDRSKSHIRDPTDAAATARKSDPPVLRAGLPTTPFGFRNRTGVRGFFPVIAVILGAAESRLARLGLTPIQMRAAARREAELHPPPPGRPLHRVARFYVRVADSPTHQDAVPKRERRQGRTYHQRPDLFKKRIRYAELCHTGGDSRNPGGMDW